MSRNVLLGLIKEKLKGEVVSDPNSTLLSTFGEDFLDHIIPCRQDIFKIIESYKLSIRMEVIGTKKLGLSSNSDFETLDKLLSRNESVNYDVFLRFRSKAPDCMQRFFTAQYFLMFPKDRQGAIASEAFLR
jgi:hypothetical protein